jgi:hypothetical protein
MKKSNNITFDDGKREYLINNDENRKIYVDSADYGILNRVNEAEENIAKYMKRYENVEIRADGSAAMDDEKAIEEVKNIGNYVREQIDYIFNAKVSNVVFDGANPLSTRKGVPLYERFLLAFVPIIQADFEEETAEAKKRIEKYQKQAERFKNKVAR